MGDSERLTPLVNQNISKAVTPVDHLYHLGMSTDTHDFEKQFGDVRFVCVGGTGSRMLVLAKQVFSRLYNKPTSEYDAEDLAKAGGRYSMYKTGPCIFVNHNIGTSPLGVVLHEVFKLLHYAKVQSSDVHFFRIGTSGGLGIPPGTVVITDKVIDGAKRNHFHSCECGVVRPLPCRINKDIVKEVKLAADTIGCPSVIGGTMGTDDFYLGQGRTDGAFCPYSEADKDRFLQELYEEYGVLNIEMEAHMLSAFTYRAGIKCAIVCTTIVNRLRGDQIEYSHDELAVFEQRPLNIVTEYIVTHL